MSSLVPDALMGSSSVETEIIVATAAVDIAVEEGQLSDDQDPYDRNRVLDRERHERRMARLALRDQISENGFALRRKLKNESNKGYFPSPLEMEEMSVEDIMTEIPVEDLRYVGSVKDRIYMPALFFQKWVLPTIRVRKALEQSQNACLHFRPIGHGFKQTQSSAPILLTMKRYALWCTTPRMTKLISSCQWKKAEKASQKD
jgi:hypothetical protein